MHQKFFFIIILLSSSALFTPASFAGTLGNETPPPASPAWAMPASHAVASLGAYVTRPRGSQYIAIQDQPGDVYTADKNRHSNGLVGLGYFLDANDTAWYNLSYGINFFYLPKTFIAGGVTSASLYTPELVYRYTVRHYPLYGAAKLKLQVFPEKKSLMFDVGLGPNFMNVRHFQELSVNGVTQPTYTFSGTNNTTLSVTAGIGLRLERVFGDAPFECGYRFFYLGHSNLTSASTQVLERLSTRNIYANAVACSFII